VVEFDPTITPSLVQVNVIPVEGEAGVRATENTTVSPTGTEVFAGWVRNSTGVSSSTELFPEDVTTTPSQGTMVRPWAWLSVGLDWATADTPSATLSLPLELKSMTATAAAPVTGDTHSSTPARAKPFTAMVRGVRAAPSTVRNRRKVPEKFPTAWSTTTR
jgi:hypothetical protein